MSLVQHVNNSETSLTMVTLTTFLYNTTKHDVFIHTTMQHIDTAQTAADKIQTKFMPIFVYTSKLQFSQQPLWKPWSLTVTDICTIFTTHYNNQHLLTMYYGVHEYL